MKVVVTPRNFRRRVFILFEKVSNLPSLLTCDWTFFSSPPISKALTVIQKFAKPTHVVASLRKRKEASAARRSDADRLVSSASFATGSEECPK